MFLALDTTHCSHLLNEPGLLPCFIPPRMVQSELLYLPKCELNKKRHMSIFIGVVVDSVVHLVDASSCNAAARTLIICFTFFTCGTCRTGRNCRKSSCQFLLRVVNSAGLKGI